MGRKFLIWHGTPFWRYPTNPRPMLAPLCLLGIARNKYLRGLPFDGIEPANQAVAVAERLNNDFSLPNA